MNRHTAIMYGATTDLSGVSEREQLILKHLPQVFLIARRIHDRLPPSVALEDLISTGTVGLIAAVDHYDPSQNVQLKTYAEHKIRGAILDSLRGLDWASRETRKKSKQIAAAIGAARQRLQREPGEEDIAAELKINLEEYQQWLTEVRKIELETLSWKVGHAGGGDLVKLIPDDEEKLPSRVFERSELERFLAEAISRMPKLESTVLSLYYQEELNLREIAEVMNSQISRVAQLKSQAVLRLRAYMERYWMQLPRREQ